MKIKFLKLFLLVSLVGCYPIDESFKEPDIGSDLLKCYSVDDRGHPSSDTLILYLPQAISFCNLQTQLGLMCVCEEL